MIRRPCASCPWWVAASAAGIPNFKLELAEGLANTCADGDDHPGIGAPWFACHQSTGMGHDVPCAGWLATEGSRHIGVRIAVAQGRVDAEALTPSPEWPPMHPAYPEMLAKLRQTSPPTERRDRP